ncbi:MAG: deoxyguanosinetriphosphate triphosphohydrolase [Eubacteriales bacterium]|nr:deoxyguanosinetriphosphate triphosphohydrolase [Eubacteriales bacterium]MDY3333079.1 deoxyguanosinetriphosphate triphosphohydrolase [Gallibacter sp.]
MINRILQEERENKILSRYACKSSDTRGRNIEENPCDLRTAFQRDRDRIVHSKAFRRLMHKTQVFISPEGDHYRTRLTHTIEVSQIARTIARALNLNEDLTEAIACGHDLGHTPFGHNGEQVLNRLVKKGFKHNIQSLRVVDVLESYNGRRGMNLTFEVRDGITNHTGSVMPVTLEGQIVKTSDRIAYINHDIDDAIRSGLLKADDIPSEYREVLGNTKSERINFLVQDMIANSWEKDHIEQSRQAVELMNGLRSFLFKNVYTSDKVVKESHANKVENIITSLFEYYMAKPNNLPEDMKLLTKDYELEEVVKDYIAGMTDRYAFYKYNELYGLNEWKIG